MYERILVPVDGSATAQRGLEEAMALAGRLGSSLRLLHVVDARLLMMDVSMTMPPQQLLDDWQAAGERVLADALSEVRAKGVPVDGVVRTDPAMRVCDVIVKEAHDCGAGLIVMGTHGRRGLRRLALGSDAELVLRESPVPVLLVRGVEGDGQKPGG
jgi:nucleotide-binding universal stress UspA family protein